MHGLVNCGLVRWCWVYEKYTEGVSEVNVRYIRLAMPVVRLSVQSALGSGSVVRVQSFPVEGSWRPRVLLPAGLVALWLCTCLYVAVRRIGGADDPVHVHIADSVPAVSVRKCRSRRS